MNGRERAPIFFVQNLKILGKKKIKIRGHIKKKSLKRSNDDHIPKTTPLFAFQKTFMYRVHFVTHSTILAPPGRPESPIYMPNYF